MHGWPLLLILLLSISAQGRELLPEAPSDGLRISVGVSCDFEERWWEVAFYPGANLPLEFRARDSAGSSRPEREFQRRISNEERAHLYTLTLAAFGEFRIDRRPRFMGPGADRAWTGERTITLAAMTLDDELGRVDRAEYAIDVLRGRGLPPASLELVERIATHSRLARLDLDCD